MLKILILSLVPELRWGIQVIKKDVTPLLIRIAKLEGRLREIQKPPSRLQLLADPSKIISIAAFIISIATTVYAWRKESFDAQIASRRQLDSTLQQMVDIGLKNFELYSKNKSDPTFGNVIGWFTSQNLFMANKAAASLSELKNTTTVDHLMVGNALTVAGDYSRASKVYAAAVKLNEQTQIENQSVTTRIIKWIDNVLFDPVEYASSDADLRSNQLASAYTSLGSNLYFGRKPTEGEHSYRKALEVISKSNFPDEGKAYQNAHIYKLWADAVVQTDCRLANDYLRKSTELFPSGKRFADNPEWTTIQYQLSWVTANCDSTGKIRGGWSVQSGNPVPSTNQPAPAINFALPPPSSGQPTR